jgi:small subunit ribosomal protein S21
MVYDNQIEKAIRDLKRKLATEGILREVKKRRHYLKPSEKKKLKQKEAEKRRVKARRMQRR